MTIYSRAFSKPMIVSRPFASCPVRTFPVNVKDPGLKSTIDSGAKLAERMAERYKVDVFVEPVKQREGKILGLLRRPERYQLTMYPENWSAEKRAASNPLHCTQYSISSSLGYTFCHTTGTATNFRRQGLHRFGVLVRSLQALSTGARAKLTGFQTVEGETADRYGSNLKQTVKLIESKVNLEAIKPVPNDAAILEIPKCTPNLRSSGC